MDLFCEDTVLNLSPRTCVRVRVRGVVPPEGPAIAALSRACKSDLDLPLLAGTLASNFLRGRRGRGPDRRVRTRGSSPYSA